jgi:hypothetical protein
MRAPENNNEGANSMRRDAHNLSLNSLIALFIRHSYITTFIERDNPD